MCACDTHSFVLGYSLLGISALASAAAVLWARVAVAPFVLAADLPVCASCYAEKDAGKDDVYDDVLCVHAATVECC